MKTIEQLLILSNNPYYQFTGEERQALHDFLSRKKEEESKASVTKKDSNSSKNTVVRVRNIVPKTIPDVEDAPEPTRNS